MPNKLRDRDELCEKYLLKLGAHTVSKRGWRPLGIVQYVAKYGAASLRLSFPENYLAGLSSRHRAFDNHELCNSLVSVES